MSLSPHIPAAGERGSDEYKAQKQTVSLRDGAQCRKTCPSVFNPFVPFGFSYLKPHRTARQKASASFYAFTSVFGNTIRRDDELSLAQSAGLLVSVLFYSLTFPVCSHTLFISTFVLFFKDFVKERGLNWPHLMSPQNQKSFYFLLKEEKMRFLCVEDDSEKGSRK